MVPSWNGWASTPYTHRKTALSMIREGARLTGVSRCRAQSQDLQIRLLHRTGLDRSSPLLVARATPFIIHPE